MAQRIDTADYVASKVVATATSEQGSGLVERLKAQQRVAQHEFVERYHARVRAVLYRILGADPDLQDLVQEVFVQAFVSVSRYRGNETSLDAWVVRVAVFTARAAIRRRQSWRRLFTLTDTQDTSEAPPAPSAQLTQELGRVYAIFDQMPADERVILALYMMEQMSLTEIRDAVGVSKSTVLRRLKRARQRFARAAARDPVLRERYQRGAE